MKNLPEVFGSMAFNEKAMSEYLSTEVFEELKRAIVSGAPMNIDIANAVATGMKEWAVAHGATHYTHWLQHHTGYTADDEPCSVLGS